MMPTNHDPSRQSNPAWKDKLAGLRDKNSQSIRGKLYKLIRILFLSRKQINGLDFSRLDLEGQVLYPYFMEGNGKIRTDFSGAKIHNYNFFANGHWGCVYTAKFSPDGRRVLTASEDCTALIWDVETGQPLFRIDHDDIIFTAEYCPFGKKIVTASRDNTARIWDAESGTLLHTLQ